MLKLQMGFELCSRRKRRVSVRLLLIFQSVFHVAAQVVGARREIQCGLGEGLRDVADASYGSGIKTSKERKRARVRRRNNSIGKASLDRNR